MGAALVIGIVGEGAGHLAHPVVPQPARAEVGLPGPLLDLPTDGPADRLWQYFSTNGFYEIPVGNSTFDFPAIDDLRGGMSGFPDRASIEKLRHYGIRTVVLHLHMPTLPGIVGYALAEPPDTAAAAAKPITGLGVTRRRVGLARDLRDRCRARRAARNRLMAAEATPPSSTHATSPPRPAPSRPTRAEARRRRAALLAILVVGLAFATLIQSWSDNQSLPLRPDPGALGGTHDDRQPALPDERQGLLPRPLVLGARTRTGALLAALLRGPGSGRRACRGDGARRPCAAKTRWSTS